MNPAAPQQTAQTPKRAKTNIVLCFDGTGDWIGNDYTNAAKIYLALDKENQICFYDGGVGTLANSQALSKARRTFLQLVDLATATSLRDKVLAGYTFLCRNYQEGDSIFLFGFSRGAYTARLVASMIHNFGLLDPMNEHLAPYLWQTLSAVSDIKAFKITANKLKRDFGCGDVDVQFMGLFDTVSSVGVIGRFAVYPNTDKNDSVLRVCHAVSMDDQRNTFPESLMHPKQKGLTEVWFPGVHRDSGGGVPKGMSRIADEALEWMETEAVREGLLMRELHHPDTAMPPRPNYPGFDPYIGAGFYPMKIFTKRVSAYRTLWPNFRHSRMVPEYSLVHEIGVRMKEEDKYDYDPVNWPAHFQEFRTGDTAKKGPDHYVLPKIGMNAADMVGIPVGFLLIVLIWNSLAGSPLGDSWPDVRRWGLPPACWAGILFVAFLALMVLGQKYVDRLPSWARLRPDGALPVVGLLVVAGLILRFWDVWPVAVWSGVLGLGLALIAQIPPLPVMRTDRVLPFVGAAAIAAPVLLDAWTRGMAVRLMSGHAQFLAMVVALACVGFAVWTLVKARFGVTSLWIVPVMAFIFSLYARLFVPGAFPVSSLMTWVVCVLLVLVVVYCVVRDRLLMAEVERGSDEMRVQMRAVS